MVAAEHLALHQCSGHRIVLAVADIWILWLCSCRDQDPHIINTRNTAPEIFTLSKYLLKIYIH